MKIVAYPLDRGDLDRDLTMSYADKKLAGSILKIRATRTLADLFRVYEIEKARIYDCGNWKHINALWEAYHSHIGCV